MFYWLFTVVVFGSILIAFYIYNYYNKRSTTARNLEKIRNKWGRPVNARRNFKMIAAYLNATDNPAKITHTIAEDLDLNNIFNFIDRTNSKPGKQYLYKKLFTPETSIESLSKLDKKIEAFNMPRPDLEAFELELAKLNSADAYYLADLFLKEHELLMVPAMRLFIRFSGIAIIGLIISLFIIPNPVCFMVLLLLIIGNIALHYGIQNKISPYTRSLPQLLILNSVAKKLLKKKSDERDEKVKESLNKLSGLNRTLKLVNFESKLADDPNNLGYAIYKFIKILFLLEPLMFITSVKRVNKYRDDIEVVYSYVAEIDALIAILSIRAGLPNYCKPVFYTENKQMDLTDMYHPLIYNCVPNSIQTQTDEGVLITGSNMSGKTTFIRSIAINTLLAQTIYTTCTTSYKAPLLKIQTSIRTIDDLGENKSYFQAEALSILDIINQSGGEEPVKSLIIIDEIFRGTNTIERIAAAKSVLTYLTDNKNFVYVSTHDLELAELLDNDYAVYTFEESVNDTRLVFDYKMKTGVLKNRNGIAILETIGYPESVVEDAYIVSEELKRKYLL
ncbi:MAG: mutS 4 [Mucilaginibacter sp.]|nr:mutS 4 [Mucilaginibacter sp.]MDB5016275.1 mutS 4 [Mucilaginibacter sp.]